MPPPSLSSSTIVSARPRRRAASSPPTSCASATSPISATTGPLATAAAPNALEIVPSIPFAPRLQSTRGASSRGAANASTSRTGIEEATNSVASGGSSAASARATSGSDSAPSPSTRVDRRGGACVGGAPRGEPLGVGRRRVRGGRAHRARRVRREHELHRRARILPRAVRVEAELRDVVAESVEPGAQRLGRRQVAAAHDEVGAPRRRELGPAQQRVVVRDRRAAAARAAERIGEQRPAELLAGGGDGRQARLGASRDDDGRCASRATTASARPAAAASSPGVERSTHGPAAAAAGLRVVAELRPARSSGSRSAKFRCTGPGRPSSDVQAARQASARIQRMRSGVASCVPTSKNHFAALP